MTITQMIYFQAICGFNSVTQAAIALNISQPALSNSIRDLENEFGINLFHRNRKRFTLTKEGEYFLAKVNPFLEDFLDLQDMMHSMGDSRNRIVLGISPYCSSLILPELIAKFNEEYPEICLDIREIPTRDISQQMINETIDVAITNILGVNPSDIDCVNIYRTETVFCVNKNNPLARLESITYEEIGNQPLIISTPSSYNSTNIAGQFKAKGLEPNIIMHADQVYTIIDYIKRDLAAGFLYKEIAADDPDIAHISLKEPRYIDIALVSPKHRRIYADTAKFIRFVSQGVENDTLFKGHR